MGIEESVLTGVSDRINNIQNGVDSSISSYFNTIQDANAATLATQRAADASQWAQKTNFQNWEIANEYNSPAAQMARFSKAGLNPALVYGNGAKATTGDVSSASAPSVSRGAPDKLHYHIDRFDPVTSNMLAQAELLKAQAASTEADSKIKEHDLSIIKETDVPSKAPWWFSSLNAWFNGAQPPKDSPPGIATPPSSSKALEDFKKKWSELYGD